MSKKLNRGRGRPEKYTKGQTRAFKSVVKKLGLLKGHAALNADGVYVNGVHYPISISLPTLAKYVKKTNEDGKGAVVLKRGRPALKKAA